MKYISGVLIAALSVSNIGIGYAASESVSKQVSRESNQIIKTIRDPQAKKWIKSTVNYNLNSIKNIEYYAANTLANRNLKKELHKNVSEFLKDLKNKVYTFEISSTEKTNIENQVLSYQKDFLSNLQNQIKQYIGKDQRQTGNMKFNLQFSEADIAISIDSFKTVALKDGKSTEVSMKFSVSIKDKIDDSTTKIMIDGSLIIIGEDMYMTLRDYSISAAENVTFIFDTSLLAELKGKTFHKKVDEMYGETLIENSNNSIAILKLMDSSLEVLMSHSILTPVAKKGNDYVLGLSTPTLEKLNKLVKSENSINDLKYLFGMHAFSSISLGNHIVSDGKMMHINYLDDSIRLKGEIYRDIKNIATIKLDLEEVGVKYPWKGNILTTPNNTTIYGSVGEYVLNYSDTLTTANATLTKGNKTIVRGKIDTVGLNTWTYDISGGWDYSKYNWEKDEEGTDSVVFEFMAKIQAEFDQFTILKPSISHELDKLSYFEKARDDKRMNALENVAGNIDYYQSYYDTYPRAPKNGCVTAIKTPSISVSFGYFEDPQSLGAGKCTNGYLYRNMKDSYIVATRVEQKSNANFDSSKLDINTASYEEIVNHTKNTITSSNPSDWLYVITTEGRENYYDYD